MTAQEAQDKIPASMSELKVLHEEILCLREEVESLQDESHLEDELYELKLVLATGV